MGMGIQIPFARLRYFPIGLSIGEARVNNTFRSDHIIYLVTKASCRTNFELLLTHIFLVDIYFCDCYLKPSGSK